MNGLGFSFHASTHVQISASRASPVLIPWRDLPESFGPWQMVWKYHRHFSGDGTWDAILTRLLWQADAAGLIEWEVSVDSTVNRTYQHGTNLKRTTGGTLELHESARRAR